MSKAKQTVTIIVCLIVIVAGVFALADPDALIMYKKDNLFDYTEENGEIYLTNYLGECENLIVPSEIDSKPVKGIKGAFLNNDTLKNVKISDGIEAVDFMAFYNCTSLVRVILPESVKAIGHAAFYGCISLESVKLGSSTEEIMPFAFSDCIFLKDIKLPQGLLFIGENAFYRCKHLEKLTIPASTEVIGGVTLEKGDDTTIDQRGSVERTSFDECSQLILKIDEANEWYALEDGKIISKVN